MHTQADTTHTCITLYYTDKYTYRYIKLWPYLLTSEKTVSADGSSDEDELRGASVAE